jgi:glutathione S-transferase
MRLLIGNKIYSSWSMRPWVLMHNFGITFDEVFIPLGLETTQSQIKAHAPFAHGKVPCLIDGDVCVWESLAIMEYLADKFPDVPLWPQDRTQRAHARSISHEMHAGFQALRQNCPMNLGKRFHTRDRGEAVAKDVARITQIWREARINFGEETTQPFLYGGFTIADAMFAPVVSRFHTYSIKVDAISQNYMQAVMDTPAYLMWLDEALDEEFVIARSELDEPTLEVLRVI